MGIPRPDLTLRYIKRYKEIATVFIKYGFGEVFDRLNLSAAYRLGHRVLRKELPPQTTYAERIRMALEELGPTFIKLGQVLSMRPFLVPLDLVIELTKLQDRVPPMKPEIAVKTVETELKMKLSDAYSNFDPNPVASASLSQVHKATLIDGTPVAVKIQRPGIKKIIEADMEILRDIAALFEKHIPESKQYEPVGLVDELSRSTRKEINFLLEARNIAVFARNFEKDNRIFIPKVYWDFSTRHMITMDWIDGIKINDVEKLKSLGLNPSEICRAGGEMVFKMIFEHGFFHADPHPGNLFVTKEGLIAPVDYGMMGTLSSSQLSEIGDILAAIVSKDSALMAYSFSKADFLPDDINLKAFEADINEMVSRYHMTPLAQIDMATISEEFFDIVHRYHFKVRSEFMVFGKAMVTYEEVARQLDPGYDFVKSAAPFVKKLIFKKFDIDQISRDLKIGISEMRDFMIKFPIEARQFTTKLNKGKIKFGIDITGMERLIVELDRSSNRLAFALVIAAIIIGSSFIMTLNVGLKVWGVPVIGLLGYSIAGILGLGLALSILRSGKL